MAYVASPTERRRFRELVKRLTPSAALYHGYRENVACYLGAYDLVPPVVAHRGNLGRVDKLRMFRSELFKREYLLAYVDSSWFSGVEPTCDAIAAVMELPGEWQPPPLVLVPASRVRARGEAFRSVLEHEFVHVNQMLLGTFPKPPRRRRAEDVLESFFQNALAEYEANVLQLTRWPRLYPARHGVSLEHWCVLQGYSHALERMLADMSSWRCLRSRSSECSRLCRGHCRTS